MFCNSLQYQASSRASTTSSNCSISNNNVTQSPTKSNGVNSKHVVHQETIEEEEEEEESNDIVVVEDGTIESVTDGSSRTNKLIKPKIKMKIKMNTFFS